MDHRQYKTMTPERRELNEASSWPGEQSSWGITSRARSCWLRRQKLESRKAGTAASCGQRRGLHGKRTPECTQVPLSLCCTLRHTHTQGKTPQDLAKSTWELGAEWFPELTFFQLFPWFQPQPSFPYSLHIQPSLSHSCPQLHP